MKWQRGYQSSNVEDRRGSGGGRMPGGRLGLGAIVILLILSVVFKRDFLSLAGGMSGDAPTAGGSGEVVSTPAEDSAKQFVSFVLDDAQQTWTAIFSSNNATYTDARLILFRDGVQSACGFAESATGPFYCPGDSQVYIDLGFYDELRERFGAPGDFAEAYVLAHEIGHHVQRLTGAEAEVRRAQQRDPARANQYSVALELQADCYAGVWASSAQSRGLLDVGDVEEGLGAAAAVGDDRIQRMGGGYVNPDAFTHGSAADRTASFKRGLESGDPGSCELQR
ncbi:MAG TPA: neutral zinc metallopeptidase [Gemmatimonadales bacterium]|nr:neutral zinc metallopeptidase [Gemmatimonadales bacterium]